MASHSAGQGQIDKQKPEFKESRNISLGHKQILLMHRLKRTPARLAILAIFDIAKRPLSAQEIIEAIADNQHKKHDKDWLEENDWEDDEWEGGRRSRRRNLAGAKAKTNIDRATIYRAITSLKQQGVIKQIDLRHNHAHYELAGMKDHHHIICLRCGKIEDVDKCGVQDMQVRVFNQSKHFAKIQEHALEFYGICKACSSVNVIINRPGGSSDVY